MKKFLLMAVAAMGLLFTACSKDEVAQPVAEKSTVTFSVATPELSTRAHGDGESATALAYAVYNRADKALLFQGTKTMSNLTTTVEIPFVNGMTYDVLFWAESADSPYLVDWDAKTVGYANASALVSNSMDYDAFYAYVNDIPEITGPVTKTVELKRPFAQLNIITNDAAEAAKSGVTVKDVKVVVKKGYTAFDFVAGNGINQGAVTFGPTEKQSDTTLAVNYLFTGGEKSLVDVEFTYTDVNGKVDAAGEVMDFASVPVQRNYRTNIIGSLLTSDGEFDVEINPDFNEPENTVSDKVATAEELLNAVAAGLDNITLTADITADATIEIPEGVEVILHLNGKTLSGAIAKANGPILKNKGTLTIKGGTISSTAKNGGSALYNNAGAVLTINDVTINGAEFEAPGWPSYGINNFGTLTINDADITTYHGAVATGGDGVTVINDATVDVGNSTETNQTSWALYVYDNGQLTVNDGTFANTKNEYGQVYGGGYICTSSTKETIINGGTFDKTEGNNNGSGFYYNNQNLVIKGGTFDADPSAYVAAGYIAVDNGNGTWTVENYQAELQEALNNGGVVTLDANLKVSEALVIPAGAEVTVNLGDKEITSATTDAFIVNDGATLTISGNGTVESNGAPIRAIGGKVIVEGGTFTQTGAWNTATSTYRYCIDSREGGEVIIEGGTFNTNNGLISVAAGSSLVIDGGEFTFENNTGGTRHFAYVSGNLTINDGVFRGVADSGAGGCFFCGASSTCNIQVNGGKFTSLWTSGSVNRIFESYASGSSINVTGGLFNTDGGITSFVEANTDPATMAEYPYKAK